MYIMTITRDGEARRILASGWTPSEEQGQREAYEAEGYTVTFGFGVWR